MTEPIEITVLRLFREFGSPPAVANFLGLKYHEVMWIVTKEFQNQQEAKKLAKKEVKEWPNEYRNAPQGQVRRLKTVEEKLLAKKSTEEPGKKEAAITFGYGGNNLLNKDKPTKNNNYYLNESRALL